MWIVKKLIERKRVQGWKQLRERYASRSMQGKIREAPRHGDFKFMSRWPWVILLCRRRGYLNTWEFVGEFATLWAARTCAAKMVKESDGVLQ